VLDLTAVDVPQSRLRPARMLVSLLAFVVLCAAVLGLGGTLLYRTILMAPGEDGRCFILDPTWCISLSQKRIEEAAAIRLPLGTEVIDSGSSKALLSGTTFAVIRYPNGTVPVLQPGYTPVALAASGLNDEIPDPLSEHDITAITAVWEGSPGGSRYFGTIVFGVDTENVTWAYIDVFWNG
jgi:hypothetical protein